MLIDPRFCTAFALPFLISASLIACSSSSRPIAPSDAGPPTDAGADVDAAPGPPLLTSLSITTESPGGWAPMPMVPAFSSSVHDYYVRCAAGGNALRVSMEASRGASSLLLAPQSSPALPTQIVSLNVNENQAVVAAARKGSATAEYWVRCLPHDMPQMRMTAHPNAGTPPPGYYMVGTFLVGNWQEAGVAGYAMVLNADGVPVWYARQINGATVYDVDNIVSGAISFFGYRASPPGQFELYYLTPPSTSLIGPTGQWVSLHDFRVIPGGYAVLTVNLKTDVDLTGLTAGLPDGGTQALGPGSSIWDYGILEFDAAGSVLWSWDGFEHIDPAKESTGPEYDGKTPDGGSMVDPYHLNSIDIDPANDNILLSGRDTNALFYIDRKTSKILWKLGGTSYSKDDAVHVPISDPFIAQHDARLRPGWSADCAGGRGQISVFDDESYTSSPARGVLYDVVVGSGGCGADDAGAPGATVAWQYAQAGNTNFLGSFRISPDGSRVICWGWPSTPRNVFTEVNAKGDDLLDFEFTDETAVSYRVIKAPLSAFDLSVLRNTAGME
jgi:hypothetical protein